MLSRLLGLPAEDLRRASPFFAVYFVLFTGLTLADGVSVALFASRIGIQRMPAWYAVTAVCTLVVISLYVTQANRASSPRMFGWILAVTALMFLSSWAGYHWRGDLAPLGMLFVTRELVFTLILMHFGTYLQDYFPRVGLNQILPFIYAGGRLGGILGGGLLGWGPESWATIDFVPIVVGCFGLGWLLILRISRTVSPCEESTQANEIEAEPNQTDPGVADKPLRLTLLRLCIQQFGNPLFFWLTATTLTFILCRWFMAYQYTVVFEESFADDVALARYLGRYAQVALAMSLLIQLLLINRLVQRIGVGKAHLFYGGCVAVALVSQTLLANLPLATATRFIENELRFGFRNPLNQMFVNRFHRSMRILVRAWSLGWLIPLGTLLASGLLYLLAQVEAIHALQLAGAVLGVVYLWCACRIAKAYDHAS